MESICNKFHWSSIKCMCFLFRCMNICRLWGHIAQQIFHSKGLRKLVFNGLYINALFTRLHYFLCRRVHIKCRRTNYIFEPKTLQKIYSTLALNETNKRKPLSVDGIYCMRTFNWGSFFHFSEPNSRQTERKVTISLQCFRFANHAYIYWIFDLFI